ncbi:MAG: hypothetical protein ACOYOT_00105 [Bacteroidales bacterium]
MKLKCILFLCLMIFALNGYSQHEIPADCIEKGTLLSKQIAKNLKLDKKQTQYLTDNLIKRETNNYFKLRGLKNSQLRSKIYHQNFAEYVACLKKEFPDVLVGKIINIEKECQHYSAET